MIDGDVTNGNKKEKEIKENRQRQMFYRNLTLYGKSLAKTETAPEETIKIVIPRSDSSTSNLTNLATANQQRFHSSKTSTSKKSAELLAKKIAREEGKQETEEKKLVQNQSDRITASLKENDWKKATGLIDAILPCIKTSTRRLNLLKSKLDILHNNAFPLEAVQSKIMANDSAMANCWKAAYFATLTNILELDTSTSDYWNDTYVRACMQRLVGSIELTKESWYRWQIEHIDSRLPRSEEGVADNLVRDYIPDEWQKKFLDAIKRNESCLVIAPTSSGKARNLKRKCKSLFAF